MTARHPIDLTHLRRFTCGDVALEEELLDLFQQQAPLTLAQLEEAQSDRQWIEAAHALKGSARAVGAQEVAELAADAEKTGATQPSKRQAFVTAIQKAVQDVADYIAAQGTVRSA